MQKQVEPQVFDWSREKVIQGRGNALLVAYDKHTLSTGNVKARPRCVWPSLLQNNSSKYLSRRVWGR